VVLGLSGTGFSLCSFDFRLPQIKTKQAEACATKLGRELGLRQRAMADSWKILRD
jgi:hypothetical protein